jgi:acyl carrier protein
VKRVTANEVRSLILSSLETRLSGMGLRPDDIPDDFDLLTKGVVDSLAIIELIAKIERHFSIKIDFEDLDPENLTIIGPFCRYVEDKSDVSIVHDFGSQKA